jgi:hypothetical protein
MVQVVCCNVPWAPTWLLFQRHPILISIGLPAFLAFSFNFPRYLQANSGKVYFEGQSYLLSNSYSPLRSILNKLCSLNSVIKCRRNLSVSPVMLLLFFFFLWRIRPSGLFSFRINLKLWILQTADRTPWMGDQPVTTSLPTQDNTNREKNAYILVPSGIRTHDSSVQASEDSSYLTPRGDCNRHFLRSSCIICL